MCGGGWGAVTGAIEEPENELPKLELMREICKRDIDLISVAAGTPVRKNNVRVTLRLK